MPLALLVLACGAYAAFLWREPRLWLTLLPAILPVASRAPWTGSIYLEEFDAFVVTTLLVGYGRLAATKAERRFASSSSGFSGPGWLIVFLALSYAISCARAVATAPGFTSLSVATYDSSLNAFRILKGFAWSALLWPMLVAELRKDRDRTVQALSLGIVLGLLLASGAVVLERVAFAALLDFARPYRVTGSFWEMHVGGAALDGFLVLSFPFAFWLLASESPARRILGAATVALSGYAIFVTFTRATYLAAGFALLILVVWPSHATISTSARTVFARLVGLILSIGVMAQVFSTSGYRGLAACTGALVWLALVAPRIAGTQPKAVVSGIGGGMVLGILSVPLAALLPKGAYVVYLLAATAALVLVLLEARVTSRRRRKAAIAASASWLALSAINVAVYWGGWTALPPALVCAAIVLVGLLLAGRAEVLPYRWEGSLFMRGAVAATLILGTAIGLHSQYAEARFASVDSDLRARLAHWETGVAMLSGPWDWLIGKGLGTFPHVFFWRTPGIEVPGSHGIRQEQSGNRYLAVAGAFSQRAYGPEYLVAQRVSARPREALAVILKVRTAEKLVLVPAVCQKHLLYASACLSKSVAVEPTGGEWKTVRVQLSGELASPDWYAPRPQFFSVAVDSNGKLAAVDDIEVVGGDGRNLLENGDFAAGASRWFFTSDHNHLPWHIKNLWLNYLFDQGTLGVIAFSLVYLAALWSVCLGRGRDMPMAPYLAASLLGFGIAGLFDSLVDVPRLTTLFFLVCFLALGLGASAAHPAQQEGGRRPRKSRKSAATIPAMVAIGLLGPLAPNASAAGSDSSSDLPSLPKRVISVGETRLVRTIAEASQLAMDGDIVEIDGGEYAGDVAVWTQAGITLRGVNGRPRLIAKGASAEGKAIWVIRSRDAVVENIEFVGARVSDANGAGIRHEAERLVVRKARFIDNENGILGGKEGSELEVHDSEFIANGAGDGRSHGAYVGGRRVLFQGNYMTQGRIGHLLKSRAEETLILYNRLTDESGSASYELDLPDGGLAVVLGNLIQQGPEATNSTIISYAAESLSKRKNELVLAYNTIVNDRPAGGAFVASRQGRVPVLGINNVTVGKGTWEVDGPAVLRGNVHVGRQAFVKPQAMDYRPRAGATTLGTAVAPDRASSRDLIPRKEYVHPATTRALGPGFPSTPGAFQSPGP